MEADLEDELLNIEDGIIWQENPDPQMLKTRNQKLFQQHYTLKLRQKQWWTWVSSTTIYALFLFCEVFHAALCSIYAKIMLNYWNFSYFEL